MSTLTLYSLWMFNSLAPGKFEWNFRHAIFKQILVIDDWGISCGIAIIWMSLDFTDDQSTLVQVMVWSRQAASHYLSQCWPRSLSPHGLTRPQWVKSFAPMRCSCDLELVIFKTHIRIDFLWKCPEMNATQHHWGSALVQVMAWCHQAGSHYLSQCWPSPVMPYGVTGLQWVKPLRPEQISWQYK